MPAAGSGSPKRHATHASVMWNARWGPVPNAAMGLPNRRLERTAAPTRPLRFPGRGSDARAPDPVQAAGQGPGQPTPLPPFPDEPTGEAIALAPDGSGYWSISEFGSRSRQDLHWTALAW